MPSKREGEETSPRRVAGTRRDRVVVLTGGGASVAFDLPSRGELVIGRDASADIVFDDATLSRGHAKLHVTPSRVMLEDLRSKNGSRVGARPLVPGRPELLSYGASAELGAVLLVVLDAALREAPRRRTRASEDGLDHDIVITPALAALDDTIRRVAPTDLPVLLLGETGVGKDVFAERVHALSRRASRPFVRIHAAAIAEALFESELFGHEQGAFTGAVAPKRGLLEAADGGTVFIDEVGELPAAIQIKLLRVLDDRRVQRVGAVTGRKVDVRFVAATNRDLAREVESGHFRQDLYQRLRGITLHIPPLRERRDDLKMLARVFLRRADDQKVLTDGALRVLARHPFWGNARELRNVIERSALLATSNEISPADLVFDGAPMTGGDPHASPTSPERASEKQRIVVALRKVQGNQTAAAALLGISRRSLVYKITEYGLPRPRKGA